MLPVEMMTQLTIVSCFRDQRSNHVYAFNRDIVFDVVNGDIVFDVVNPFPSKGFPIDE